MSYSDGRPLAHGELGGQVGIGYRVGDKLWAVVSSYVGGSWFDFSGLGISGKVEQTTWRIRGGFDHYAQVTSKMRLCLGIGAEYGETRSWFDTYVLPEAVALGAQGSDEGPHVYSGGGYLRVGAEFPLRGSLSGYAEAVEGLNRSHARQTSLRNDLNWLGQSFELGAGLRWFIW